MAFRTTTIRLLESAFRLSANVGLWREYAREQFQKLMTDNGVTCSMRRSGNVWDNAAMESFLSSLKTERIRGRVWLAKKTEIITSAKRQIAMELVGR